MAIEQLSSVTKSREHRNKQNRLLRKQMRFDKVPELYILDSPSGNC